MGAWMTEQVGSGKTAREAYGRAVRNAEAEYGHQEGYSGAINSKDGGFVLVELPARTTYAKLQEALEEVSELKYSTGDEEIRWASTKREKAKAVTAQKRARARLARLEARFPSLDLVRLEQTYSDKWGSPLAVELRGAELKRYRVERKRGERTWIFFGYAPS